MVNKKFENKKYLKADKYIFVLLLLSYIMGISIGSFFVLSDIENAEFANEILFQRNFKVLLFFIMALLFKYSGIMSGVLGVIPLFIGVQNAANYCSIFLSNQELKYKTAFTMLKDTAIVMLLIFYIIIIINQIINKKYVIKRDIKYFIIYFTSALLIIVIEYIINTVIF